MCETVNEGQALADRPISPSRRDTTRLPDPPPFARWPIVAAVEPRDSVTHEAPALVENW